MHNRKPGAPRGYPADSPKQRKQQTLSWMLHQCMGANANLGPGWNQQRYVPPAVAVRLEKVRSQLRLMERELRFELRNIK